MNEYIIIAIIIALAVGFYFLMQTKYKKEVSVALLYLVSQAEVQFGAGTGQLKYSAVASWLWERLPSSARFFLPYSLIERLIEDAVKAMKIYLEQNVAAQALIIPE